MARLLQGLHDTVYMTTRRSPEVKVYLYDQSDTLSAIVLNQATQTPMDITDYISNGSINSQEDNATTASFTIIQPTPETLSPYVFCGRKIIRIFYIDAAVENEESWICLFTGVVVGNPGYKRNRDGGSEITINCQDRSYFYKDRKMYSPKYDQGEDLGTVAIDLATNDSYGMGLDRSECRFGLLRSLVRHTEVSFYEVTKMEALQDIGFVVDKKPVFDGEGFLCMRDTNIDKPPVRKYQDEALFIEITWPQGEPSIYNKIKIIGLSCNMSKIVSANQELATVTGTVGYFTDSYKTRIWFTEDHSGRAQNTYISHYSLNGQLGSIIGGKPSLYGADEYSCILYIRTPYQAYIFIGFFSTYIAFFVVDSLFSFVPWVSDALMIAAASWLCIGLALMQQIGTFEVTISGEPYKYVYKEIEAVAQWDHLENYEIQELTHENHLIADQATADEIALRELKRETAKGCQRSLSMPFDPVLEWGDIIEMPDGTRYYITGISVSFTRNEPHNMTISAIVARNGKEYNDEVGYSLY